ncbi:hypothetical protein B0H13DRAFT_2311115 [Mycena leptocephala]|nr:hypothetical protein B0H13DRAFT_2311115 [Mycena leptocephala]
MFPDTMIATIKRVVGGRKAAERRLQKMMQQHEEFMRRCDDPLVYTGVPWPEYRPEEWPSQYHHKCDMEWCGFANRPRTTPGDYRCGHTDCPGNFNVSPEMAAATAVAIERRRRKKETAKTLRSLDPADSGLLRSSGKSAMEARRRPRIPSYSSVATAPTLVCFPHQPDLSFTPNPLHPNATSTLRAARPSLPASGGDYRVRAPGQRLPSQPVQPPPNSNWWVST